MVDHNKAEHPPKSQVPACRPPSRRFILLAPNYEAAFHYCERNGIDAKNPQQVVVMTKDEHFQRVRGLDRDTPVVELGWPQFGNSIIRELEARFGPATLAEL